MEKKILVVDDNKSILKIVKHWLSDEGYNVDVTRFPKQVLEMAKGRAYNLIILDIMMEEMNGFEVLENLRANKETEDVPVMIITAITLYKNIASEARAMFNDFLAKPFHKDELLEKVRHALTAHSGV